MTVRLPQPRLPAPRRSRTSKNRELRTTTLWMLVVLILIFVVILFTEVNVYLSSPYFNKSLTGFLLMNYPTLTVLLLLTIPLLFIYFKVSITVSRREIDFSSLPRPRSYAVLPKPGYVDAEDEFEFVDSDELLPPSLPPVRAPQIKKIARIIQEKKYKFLNLPNISFHFANHALIKSFFYDYFNEPIIENQALEITGETSKDIRGRIPQVIDGGIGGKDISKRVSNIKFPDLSSNAMFLRYQKETIKKEQVTLGLEEVDIELTDLDTFDDTIGFLKEEYGIEIVATTLSSQRDRLKEKAAEKTMTKLEQAAGWVLIEGKFKVEREGDLFTCTYFHPVNDYLTGQTGPITISFSLAVDSLEEHIQGNYVQSVGKSILLRVYGEVFRPIDRKAKSWDLRLTPIAVY